MTAASELAEQLAAEASAIDLEVREIDLLVTQARTEAGRHESRRAAAAEKLARLPGTATTAEVVELASQVATLTRRSALMDAQLEILEGKKRSVARLQETIQAAADRVRGLDAPRNPAGDGSDADEEDEATPPAVSRLVLAAQEDLRREIARSMHDGPAQSLTNIVLQAEIVERLVARDPALAANEVHQLVAMVQQTLEATKTFIFDVRPMVLDDLGLVPTLRRSARDRGRRAGLTVDFASVGVDRRLPVDLESGLFRIADETLAAYLAAGPERVSLNLDWQESLVITLRAERSDEPVPVPAAVEAAGEHLPPALAAMVEDRRSQRDDAVAAAEKEAAISLPSRFLRDANQRATTLGIAMEVLDGGSGLQLTAPLAADAPDADGPGATSPATTGPGAATA
jgi:two-component system, NarL family, sensor histidine kinase DegS